MLPSNISGPAIRRRKTTHTGRNNEKRASHLGWLTWILIFPLSVKCQRLSVVVVRGKIGEYSGQDQLNPCLLINYFITTHEVLNLRGQKCCKINVCQIGSGNATTTALANVSPSLFFGVNVIL